MDMLDKMEEIARENLAEKRIDNALKYYFALARNENVTPETRQVARLKFLLTKHFYRDGRAPTADELLGTTKVEQ